MKRLLPLFLLCFLFVSSAHAQLGVRGGLNVTTFAIDFDGVTLTPDSRVGIQGGITYDLELGTKSKLRLNALYTTKGFLMKEEDENSSSEQRLTTSYLEVPISFVYFVTTPGEESSASGFYVEGGPYVGTLLTAQNFFSFTFENQDPDVTDEDAKDEFTSLDFGLNVGVGYKFQQQFSVGINYGLGLANLIPDDLGGDEAKANNRAWSLYAIYHF